MIYTYLIANPNVNVHTTSINEAVVENESRLGKIYQSASRGLFGHARVQVLGQQL